MEFTNSTDFMAHFLDFIRDQPEFPVLIKRFKFQNVLKTAPIDPFTKSEDGFTKKRRLPTEGEVIFSISPDGIVSKGKIEGQIGVIAKKNKCLIFNRMIKAFDQVEIATANHLREHQFNAFFFDEEGINEIDVELFETVSKM